MCWLAGMWSTYVVHGWDAVRVVSLIDHGCGEPDWSWMDVVSLIDHGCGVVSLIDHGWDVVSLIVHGCGEPD